MENEDLQIQSKAAPKTPKPTKKYASKNQKVSSNTETKATKPIKHKNKAEPSHISAVPLEYNPIPEGQESAPSQDPLYENLFFQEEILNALKKNKLVSCPKELEGPFKVLLGGTDVFINKVKDRENLFLIVLISALYRRLAGGKTPSEGPYALFLFGDDMSAQKAYKKAQEIFGELQVPFLHLNELAEMNTSEQASPVSPAAFIFSTPQAAHDCKQMKFSDTAYFSLFQVPEKSFHEIEAFFSHLHHAEATKAFLFTKLSPRVRELSFKHLNEPQAFIEHEHYPTNETPKQYMFSLNVEEKFQTLLNELKAQPVPSLVFVRTKPVADWVAYKLHKNGFAVESITGQLNFKKRQALLKAFQQGQISVIVCRDNLEGFGHEKLQNIFHFDLPETPTAFIQRLQTIEGGVPEARSIAFVCEDYGFHMKAIEETLGYSVPVTQSQAPQVQDASDYPLEADGSVKKFPSVLFERMEQRHEGEARPEFTNKFERKSPEKSYERPPEKAQDKAPEKFQGKDEYSVSRFYPRPRPQQAATMDSVDLDLVAAAAGKVAEHSRPSRPEIENQIEAGASPKSFRSQGGFQEQRHEAQKHGPHLQSSEGDLKPQRQAQHSESRQPHVPSSTPPSSSKTASGSHTTSHYPRREDKVKEVLEAAKTASQNAYRQRDDESSRGGHPHHQRGQERVQQRNVPPHVSSREEVTPPSLLKFTRQVVQDVVNSALKAAKASFESSLETENLPKALSTLFHMVSKRKSSK